MNLSDILTCVGTGVAIIGIAVMLFPPTYINNKIRLGLAYPLIIVGIGFILFPIFHELKKAPESVDEQVPTTQVSKQAKPDSKPHAVPNVQTKK